MTSPIVDAHMHLYRSPEEGEHAKAAYRIWEYGEHTGVHFSPHDGDVESALRAMDEAGAAVAIITNLLDVVRPDVAPADDLRALNHWLCNLAAVEPRFLPLIAVDPNYHSVEASIEHLEDMVAKHGALGIKIHPPMQRFDLTDKTIWPIFETCVRLDVVVVSHTGPSVDGWGGGEPNTFRPVLDAFPSLRVSLAHLGGGSWRQVPALARDYPQIVFDLCEIIEWTGAPNAPSQIEMAQLIQAVGPHRVMMGSDFPWYEIDHTVERVRALPGLSAAEKDQILGDNAAGFFRLEL